jgi:hypothetical protein
VPKPCVPAFIMRLNSFFMIITGSSRVSWSVFRVWGLD